MLNEEEYEIESITEARVSGEKKGKRWEFRVRWKGYKPSDDTWEPVENLTGSGETLRHFIRHIDTGGRDHRNLTLFSPEEHFFPVGPPMRRKAKEKKQTLELDLPSFSRTRKRGSSKICIDEDRYPSKRSRPTLQTFGSKPNLLLTGTINNSSPNSSIRQQPCSSISITNDITEPKPGSMADFPNFSEISQSIMIKREKVEMNVVTPSLTRDIQSNTALHRTRTDIPLVQPPTKERHTTSAKNSSTLKRKKPGPGRSSDGLTIQLTAGGKEVKNRRGEERAEVQSSNREDEGSVSGMTTHGDVSVETPKPAELLHLAGLDTDYPDLPVSNDNTGTTLSNQVVDARLVGDSAVKESLFPTNPSEVKGHPEWKRPTIFGLLGLGTDVSYPESRISPDQLSIPFQINLDSRVSLPVLLKDYTSVSTFPLGQIVQLGPPGKFYCGSHATDLLATLKVKSFARIVLSPEATEAHMINFEHFEKRLRNNELFVEMFGQDLLAFCSGNASFTQRLNFVPKLLVANAILVAHVSIENQSAFADVVMSADDTIWSRYVLNTVAV